MNAGYPNGTGKNQEKKRSGAHKTNSTVMKKPKLIPDAACLVCSVGNVKCCELLHQFVYLCCCMFTVQMKSTACRIIHEIH